MTSTDILLALIIAGAALLGFFWGVVRSLLMLAAWFVVFVLAANLSEPLGRYLASQWTGYSPSYDQMAAFGLVYAGGLILAVVLVWLGTRGAQGLTRFPLLDDIVGGALGVCVGVLGIAGAIIILATVYAGTPAPGSVQGPEWSMTLYQSLLASTIGGAIDRSLIPALGALLGPLLPAFVRDVMV